ncbi:hypothetical protein CHCC5027_3554 [Bacillus paralicheniformis]|uniref:hypothetical protein n=1 Tax=Bacillus paralicheniformis TaxID=1648923 RepID=UPI0011A07D2D|nr:hypothetical protein [Bacillus paralicheniformis]TWJ39641.1 hypothetical protein CHCC5027_3554 [Bacillus paralicheniformis]
MPTYTKDGLYLPDRSDAIAIDTSLAENFTRIQSLFDRGNTFAETYGASGDGSTDDTSALQSAINNTPEGGTLELGKNAIYRTSQRLVGTKNIRINGNGSKIIASHQGEGLVFEGTLKASTTAKAYTAFTRYIDLDSTSSIAVGDQLRIYHTGDLYDTSRSYFYKGGNVLVTKVSGSRVFLNIALPFAMSAGAKVDVYKPITVCINDLEVTHDGTLGQSPYGTYGLNIKYSKNSVVSNVKVDNFNHNFKMDMTINNSLIGVETGRAYFSGSGESYGVSNYSSTGLLIMASSMISGRHGFTVTGQEPSYNTTLIGCEIGQEDEVSLPGLDCHGNNFSLTATNCTLYNFHLAGNCVLDGCTVYPTFANDKNSFSVADSYDRANYVIRDCNLLANYYELDAYGQQATSTRKYIGSIVFENVVGNNYTQCTFKARDRGATVQSIIQRLVVKNCKEFTLVTNERVDRMYFENVRTTRDAKIIEQVEDAQSYMVKFESCTIPARYRCVTLIDFDKLTFDDCDWHVVNSSAASMQISGGEVYFNNTDFTYAGGIETAGIDILTTTQTSSLTLKQPSSITTKRRVSYTSL